MLLNYKKVDEELRAFKEDWENNVFLENHLKRPTVFIRVQVACVFKSHPHI